MDSSQLTNLRRAKTLYADSLAQKQLFNNGLVTRIHTIGDGLHNSYLLEGAIFTEADSYTKIVEAHTPVKEEPPCFYIETCDKVLANNDEIISSNSVERITMNLPAQEEQPNFKKLLTKKGNGRKVDCSVILSDRLVLYTGEEQQQSILNSEGEEEEDTFEPEEDDNTQSDCVLPDSDNIVSEKIEDQPKKSKIDNFTTNKYGTMYAVGQQIKYYKPLFYVYR